MTSTILRRCATCKEWLPADADYFQRRRSRPSDPWVSSCKKCTNDRPVAKVSELIARDGFKVCRKCRIEKPATIEHFAKSKQTNDGIRTYCKECDKVYRAQNQAGLKGYAKTYRESNKEKGRIRNKWYWQENRDDLRAKNKEWRQANRDYIKSKGAQYRKQKGDEINARIKEWRKKNPEKIRVKIQRRRARKLSLPNTLTQIQWAQCLEYWGGYCAYCGRPPGLFHTICLDHFVTLSSLECEGTTATNCVPACHGDQGCNNIKCNRSAETFLTEKFGPKKAAAILKRIAAYFDHVRANP